MCSNSKEFFRCFMIVKRYETFIFLQKTELLNISRRVSCILKIQKSENVTGGVLMRIKNNINIINFLKQVQNCSSEVLFETPEGDRIALKSTLSQYIFCTIASNPELLQSGIIRFEKEEDKILLADFLYG